MEICDLGPEDPRWAAAFPVLVQVRAHLGREAFDEIYRSGFAQGLRYTAAFDAATGRCLGVAGWRQMATTSSVRKVYVDDLVTDEGERSRGVGAALLHHLAKVARDAGCRALELDSGVQRHDAHRFYLREGFVISSHHFSKPLE